MSKLKIAIEVEADMSANIDRLGVNDPLLFNARLSRLEDLVGETEVEIVVGVISFGLKPKCCHKWLTWRNAREELFNIKS